MFCAENTCLQLSHYKKIINSLSSERGGEGSMGTLKSENSCSSFQPALSSAASVSESNSMVTSSGFDINNISPSSLKFNGLKFDVDVDVEVPSPTSLIWESLFADQLDSGVDFMISSPKRTPDLMISSPNRSSSILGYNHNYFQAMREQNLPGGSPPSCNSSHVGAFSTPNKGKAQSPLHRDSFGAYPIMKLSGVKCSLETNETPALPVTLNCHTSTKTSRPCGTVNEVATLGGSQHAQESNLCQMDSFATQPLAQQQQQQQQQLQQLQLSFSAEPEQEQDSGLQLVHLLLACAEAIDKEDYMSAKRFLHHLYKVVTPIGNSMQRVAACFTDALCARLAAATLTQNPTASSQKTFPSFPLNSVDILKVYQILYQACPYIKFAHFTANQAIFEAFEGEERVHVVDLDILQGYQWPAFMQALAARPGGAPFLRITGVGCPPESVRETGRCLTELAHSLHLQFEFHPVGEGLKDLKPHMFHRHIGEALAVNSVNRLHHVPSDYLWNLLGIIQDQEPNVVTIVEQEANHNSPYFLSRFLEALHYYSAIFDSLDVTLPADSAERAKVEQYFFAPEIRNIVACEGPERVERHERLEKWRKLMEEKGFKGVPLSANAVTQSKILLGLYSCNGYRLTEDGGCLLLGWQDRAVIAASAWTCC